MPRKTPGGPDRARAGGRRPRSRWERGSAVLVAAMVSAVLALMGVAFITLSETETWISVNRRDAEQVLSVAESGVNMAVTWYNNPDATRNLLLPPTASVIQNLRVGDSDFDGTDDIDAPTNGLVDYYRGGRGSGGYRLFDRPYRGNRWDTLWGDEDNPDILIQDDESVPGEYLDEINALFNPSSDKSLGKVRITEIRIYAPPTDSVLRTRYGIATIQVTAVKTREPWSSEAVARQTVRAVLNEIPFPVPIGALEAEGSIDQSGNFGAHWGGTGTEDDLNVPNGANYPGPTVPRLSKDRFGFADFSPDAPDLDPVAGGTQNLLTQLIDTVYAKDEGLPDGLPDPWLVYMVNGEFADAVGNPAEQPWPYQYNPGWAQDNSHVFQHQTYLFPEADYEVWKEIARMPLPNVRYFEYAGLGGSAEPIFREDGRGNALEIQHWVNLEYTVSGVEPSIFFFDTANSLNPQNGGPGVLAPVHEISSGDIMAATGGFYVAGFVFANVTQTGTSGISTKGRDIWANPPSEPFLDEGIDLNGNGIVGDTQPELETAGNGWWDFDIDNDGVSDGDRYTELYGTAAWTAWASAHEYADGVVPHGGANPATLASKPHEPFLNLAWRDQTELGWEIPVDFDHEATFTRFVGTDINDDGAEDVTTTLWDLRGAKLELIRCNINGLWYSEGSYDGSGNMNVYGSVFYRSGFQATGSPNIWFNSEIYRGNYPFNTWDLPRVYVSSLSTSE